MGPFALTIAQPSQETLVTESGRWLFTEPVDLGGIVGGSEVASVTWRVGGTGTDQVYGTFAAALAALAGAGGSITTLKLDPSGGALVIPAGTYDLTGVQLQSSGSADTSVTVSAGVVFSHAPQRIDGLVIVNNATAPVITLGASVLALMGMTGTTFSGGAESAPFVAATGASSVVVVLATACDFSDWFATTGASGSAVFLGAEGTAFSEAAVQGSGIFAVSLDVTCVFVRPGTFTGTLELQWNYSGTPGVAFTVDSGATGKMGPVLWEKWADLNAQFGGTGVTSKCSLTFGGAAPVVPALPEGASYLISAGNGFELELRALYAGQVVELEDGVMLHIEKTLRVSNGLHLRWQASTVSPWDAILDANVGQAIYLNDGSVIEPSASTPPTLPFGAWTTGSGALAFLDAESELLGSSTVRAFTLNGAKQLQLAIKGGGVLGSRALGGSGTATAFLDSSAANAATQPDLGTFTVITRASALAQGYVPATLSDWSGTAPSSTANALDRIAAHTGPIP